MHQHLVHFFVFYKEHASLFYTVQDNLIEHLYHAQQSSDYLVPLSKIDRMHALHPKSFSAKEWWAHLGSNQGPTGYEPVALPIELWALTIYE
jgi:hypothetical protein